MRLRTYESFWLIKNGLLYSYPSTRKNLSAEIVVLGGGITGALISHALIEAGYKTILLDKGDFAMGSTSATTSMLQYEIDVPLYKLANKIGETGAALCYKAGIDAIKKLQQLVKKEKIDCGFEMKNSLYIAHSASAAEWLYKEYEMRKKHQLGVKWLEAKAIRSTYGLISHGGILSDTGASIDAYKLAHKLIHKNAAKGLQVYDQVEIKKIEYHTNGVRISVKNGNTVKAKKVIFCTGYSAVEMLDEPVAKLRSTFACVSEENIALKKELYNVLVWDTRDPYMYMRTTDDNRLLIGGGDSDHNAATYLEKTKGEKSKMLIRKLGQVIPGINFIDDFNWAGIFGSTKDGLPYIGAHKGYKNALFVLGFGGNGITFSIQGMKIITDMLTNKKSAIAEFYKFDR